MDAITLLRDDHARVEKLFVDYEKAGDRAYARKRQLVDRMIEELSIHASIEEQLFYPVTRATVDGVDDEVLENVEEHHVVKWVLHELEQLDSSDERFDAKVAVLATTVRHHVEEEEDDYFRAVRAELGRKALVELGDAMEQLKAVSPRRPHPRSPQSAPANVVVGLVAGTVDRVQGIVHGVVKGGMDAAADVVNRVTGQPRRRPAPTGRSVSRTTAGNVRSGADQAVEDAIAAVRRVKATGEDVVDRAEDAAAAARRGARRTVDTAAEGAKETRATATRAADRTTRAATGNSR